MARALNVLMVGVGMVADMHASAIRAIQGRVHLAAVHSRQQNTAEVFSQKHGVDTILSDLEDRNALKGFDFAILTTPPNARLAFIEPFAKNGLPVLVEKPVARDFAEAAQFVDAFSRQNVPLGVVLQHRMRDAARLLLDRVSSGQLGALASAELRVPWWRDQSYYEVPGRGSFDRDGGGVLITQAIHSLDLLLQFCGPVDCVQAMTATTPLHVLEAEDFAGAILKFCSGAIGSVVASVTHYPGGAEEIILNGTKGSAHLTSNHLRIALHSGEIEEFGADAATGGGADPMAFSHAWHQAVIEDFAEAIINDRPPSITGRSALAVHALIDAIHTSADAGMQIKVEPANE